MYKDDLKDTLISSFKMFNKSTDGLSEEDSSFAPVEGMYTVAQQVAHVAQTIDWFVDGAFGDAFDMDFEKHHQKVKKITSLEAARHWLEKSVEYALTVLEEKSEEELCSLLPAGPVLGGYPRYSIGGAIADHSAHHRGSLAVYSRLLGKVPSMPYVE